MDKLLKRTERILSLFFGIAAFLFFTFFYQNHLHYEEQFQLFLFTSDYWTNLMSRPGGLADYLGTFFAQFYYYSWLGAFIIAAMLVLLQILIKALAIRLRNNRSIIAVTFIPSLFYWILLCNENYLLAGLIAVLLTLFAANGYTYLKSPALRIVVTFIALPLLYWLAGGVFWLFAAVCVVLEFGYFKQFTKLQGTLFVIGVLVFVACPPLIAKHFLQYPLSRLWWGLSYNRFPVISPLPLFILWLFVIGTISVGFVPAPSGWKKNKISVWVSLSVVLMVLASILLIHSSANWKKEEIMAYDYYARTQNWNKIINMANHKDPNSPLSVACLNLALYKDGNMGDCMFRYYQNGTEGLLPTFQRDFTLPMIAGEIYYHLGFLNTSMQYSFEAMEALPDHKKSVRAMMRIAEINLLNGQDKVAEKYLHILQHTLFYSKQANEMLQCVGNEAKIDANPEWASLRKYRITDDFLFSENEKERMLELLITHCQSNKIAYEYLMAYTLLAKDLTHFAQYLPLGMNLGYREIPAHYQEALLYYWLNTSQNQIKISSSINPAIRNNLNSFVRMYKSNVNKKAMGDKFSQTYWYYLFFR